MERLSASEAGADLGTYLVATGSAGVELVGEGDCQLRMACGVNARPEAPPKALADVTEIEIDGAVSNLLKELGLRSYNQAGARELSNVIKAEWQKARAARTNPT